MTLSVRQVYRCPGEVMTELRYIGVGQRGERFLDSGNTVGKCKGLTSWCEDPKERWCVGSVECEVESGGGECRSYRAVRPMVRIIGLYPKSNWKQMGYLKLHNSVVT